MSDDALDRLLDIAPWTALKALWLVQERAKRQRMFLSPLPEDRAQG